ncbi:protein-disulfide reductase DsbD [Pelagibacterium luteolum]|uniref:Thiol:disulfide interchange protein DsbD n=1 Tax=Pelagibacterium luteolum TaxID=440168 RepID=A0A1G7XBV5_9HYPH|nr:protein-disulfide reductase DsbD [Pelagibacterium luteolum]SDG81676.1 thiol:disulfide interchange protein DsbD [Pelagibacterium luteolum]
MALLRFLFVLPVLLLATLGQAQEAMPLPVDEAFTLSADAAQEGVALTWQIEEGYYLYRDHIEVIGPDDQPIALDLPHGEVTEDPTFGTTETLWDDFTTVVPVDDADTLSIRYQGCMDGSICYPPVNRTLDVTAMSLSDDLGFGMLAGGNQASVSSPITIAQDTGGSLLSQLAERGGALFVLGGFLLFGIALAFTPCVFPMYPILAGTLTRAGQTLSTTQAFLISLTYVLGMAIAYGLLGLAAAWSGQNLQMALQSPWAVWGVAVLFVVLATSMFGAFELQLPSSWTTAITRRSGGGGGFAGAGIMGFLSALIVGPCVTAPLAAALIYIAQTGDAFLGAAALFALGMGKGIPLIIFGTVGGKALPRAGAWMERVKHVFGFVFIAAAVWMLERALPGAVAVALWAALAVAMAIYVFWLIPALRSGWRFAGGALGALVLAYGGVLGFGAATGATSPLEPLAGIAPVHSGGETRTLTVAGLDGLDDAVASTQGQNRIVYFTADWCISCAVIEREIWDSPEALAGLDDTAIIKVDVTENSPSDQRVMQALQVYGPPTLLYVDANAAEVEGTRLIGEIGVTDFREKAIEAGML